MLNRVVVFTYLFLFATSIVSCTHSNENIPSEEHSYELNSDIVWASPKGFDLTMDIYTPDTGKENYPVIVIFHGGGWLINNKSIMRQTSEYLASKGEYVVCNVNYRLLGDLNNTVKMNEIVEDAMGAVLWIKKHIANYNGDPEKIILTGDSAGGHLATIVTLQGRDLSSEGFSDEPYGFNPTWLPEGKTAEDIASENGLEVQAAMISYGAFDILESAKSGMEKPTNIFWALGMASARGLFGDTINYNDNPEFYKKVSPIYNIPSSEEMTLPPMLFTVGEKDNLTTPASIEDFITRLKAEGHTDLEYWIHEGRPHAFLDSGSNDFLKISFEKDAPPALDVMLEFLNNIFYINQVK